MTCDTKVRPFSFLPASIAKRLSPGRRLLIIVLCAALVLCSAVPLYAFTGTTVTALQLSSGATVGEGVVVTFTASVTTGGSLVKVGFVTFCDASAKYCEDLAVLGTSAVNSTGVATMKLVLPPGIHKISAVYNPTVVNASSSSAIQTVDVPVQVKALPVPVITKTGTTNPLPVQASVSVVGRTPFTGTLSVVQTQNKQALVTAPVGPSTTTSGFAPFVSYEDNVSYFTGGGTVAADFNGDGLTDIATAGTYGFSEGAMGYMTVSLNDPAHPGQFLPAIQDYISQYASGIVTGDFNNDGLPDVAVNIDYSTWEVLLNDPANPGHFVGTSITTTAIFQTAADLNQDGVLDLIGINGSGIDVFFGDPAHPGQFINETTIPGGTGTVVAADMNGDGVLDLVANDSDPSAYAIVVLLGEAGHPGQFLAPVSYPLTSSSAPNQINDNPGELAVGDFNQDGHPDVVVDLPHSYTYTSLDTSELNVLLNNPDSPGQLMPATDYPVNFAFGVSLGDFNGDGVLDIAQLNTYGTSPDVLVFPGNPNGSGQFLTAQTYPVLVPESSDPNDYVYISSLTVADLNADGLTDFVPGLQSLGDGAYPLNTLLAQQTQTATASFPSVAYDPQLSPLAQALYSGDDNYDIIGSCDIDLAANPGGPVLYDIHADVSDVDATVLWYWKGDVGAVDYGTTSALGSTTDWQRAAPSQLGGPSYIRLNGLKPATKYYYQIRAIGYFSGCSHWTTTSPIASFTTAP